MYIARILYPVEVLGPGKRIGIWFCGCPRRCVGCSNPELWEFDKKYLTSLDTVKKLISTITDSYPVDGFTITGGDLLYQYDDLIKLIYFLRTINEDILVYTGYTIDELEDKNLEGLAVLIDGQYIESRNNNSLLRGSDNQKIYVLNEKYVTLYEDYLSTASNQIQNFTAHDSCISVGIHKNGFSFCTRVDRR